MSMNYRNLGKTGLVVSEIGMGLEHLLDKEESVVIDTIGAAIRGGVTFFDCHPGHDYREDSINYQGYDKLGKAISGKRDSLCLTYMAYWQARAPEDARPRFEYFLRALGTDHVDVFIIQFCDKATDYEQVTGDGGILEYAQALKRGGQAKSIGISTHSTDIAYRAIENGAFDVILYPINPAFDVVTDGIMYDTGTLETLWDAADGFDAAGKAGPQPRKGLYGECARKGVGLVAMKPFGGGYIFRAEKSAGFTPVNLISYVLAQNGVSSVIPGCTKPQEIEQILAYNTSADAERDYSAAVAGSRWSVSGNCVYCNHCLPCAVGINIAQVNRLLDAYEDAEKLGAAEAAGKSGAANMAGAAGKTGAASMAGSSDIYGAMPVKASACIKCSACIERCPFDVKVTERMARATKIFE